MAQGWERPTTEAPPRTGLAWNGAVWVDPPTGRVWREGPPAEVVRGHLAEVLTIPAPTEFDRDVALLLTVITRRTP